MSVMSARRSGVMFAALFGCLAILPGVSCAQAQGVSTLATSASGKFAPTHPSEVTPPVTVQIEQAVTAARFADSYGGYVVGADGVVSVYVTEPGMAGVASTLANASIPASDYRLAAVPHSMTDLHQLTLKLADDQTALKRKEST